MSQTLYVGGLSYSTTNDSLAEYFSAAGTVVSANIVMDRMTNRSRGFGFVEMGSPEEAQRAIEMFNGKEFEGRTLTVNIARPKEEGRKRFSNNRSGGFQSFRGGNQNSF